MSSSRVYRHLSPQELADAANDVAAAANAQRERIALVGGYALHFYGSPRLTGDLDVLSERPIAGLPRKTSLTFGGYRTATPSKVPVDVIIRNDDYAPLYEAALGFAVRRSGVPIRIVQLEYLLTMKYALDRPKDQGDVEFIIAYTDVNIAKTTKLIRKYLGVLPSHEFDHHVEETLWKKSRGLIPYK